MTVTLNDFESNLLRLCIVWYRVMAIHKEYPKHMIDDKHHLSVRHLFREITVEQLHNFIKIRKDLLKTSKFKKLDNIIVDLIKPILEKEEPIKKLRNNYVAHIQEEDRKFKTTMGEIIEKYNVPTSFSYYSYLCGLAFFYCGIVERNFKSEWDKALLKYEAISGAHLKISSGFKMNEVQKKITEILAPLQVKLYDNGYVVIFSKNVIEQLRKKYN